MSDVLADRYELGVLLGAGGMARVVRGHDRVLDREVAVKLLRETPDPSARERFVREARSAARLRHPGAVLVYDAGESEGRPFIVMELVDGETLGDLLDREGPLDIEEVLAIALGVVEVLSAAHEQGLIHRDVKPGNVLLPVEGGVKLADFGIAKAMDEATSGLTATGAVMGTASYLAPELVEGGVATPASDVYSVGCLLYALLTGDPPFTGDSALAVAYAQRHSPVPPIETRRAGVPADLRAVLSRALEKDPADRYPDAAALQRALLEGPEAVPAAPSTPLPAAPPPPASGPSASGGSVAAPSVAGSSATGSLPPTQRMSPASPHEVSPSADEPTRVLGADAATTAGGNGRGRSWTAMAGILAAILIVGLIGWWATDRFGGGGEDTDGDTPDTAGPQDETSDDPGTDEVEGSPEEEAPADGDTADPPDADGEEGQEPDADAGPDADADPDAGEPSPADASTVDGLIALLVAAPSGAYGEKHDDLLADLVDLTREDDPAVRAEEAEAVRVDVVDWVEDGELDGELGRAAIAVLEREAAR